MYILFHALIFVYGYLLQTNAIPCPLSCYDCNNSYHGNNPYKDANNKTINCIVYPDQNHPVKSQHITNQAYLNLHRYSLIEHDHKIIEKKKRHLLGLINSEMNTTLPKLIIMHLQHNLITDLNSKNFPRCPQLIEFDITDNRIETIEDNLFSSYFFPKLRLLKLGHNKITNIDVNIGLPHLLELHLSKNKIVSLSNTMISSAMRNLTKIVADHNLINTVEKFFFDNMKNLKIINLHNNPLTNFTVFTDLFNKNIKLDKNSLNIRCQCEIIGNHSTNDQVVCNNPRGCAFCLRNNKHGLFYASYSTLVDLDNYCVSRKYGFRKPQIEYANPTNFLPQYCTSSPVEPTVSFELVKSVSCNASSSKFLCDVLKYSNLWRETENITIQNVTEIGKSPINKNCDNYEFDSINIHDYSKIFPALKILDIQHSKTRRLFLKHGLSLAPTLQTVLLNNNKIGPHIFTSNFPYCKNLKRLEIANNSIDSIDKYLFTTNFPNLEYLVLDGNNIKYVDFSLSLLKLVKVSLFDNAINGLDKSVFKNTPSLKQVDLRRGNLLSNFSVTKDLIDVDIYFIMHDFHVNSLGFHCQCYENHPGETPKWGNWGWSSHTDAEKQKCLNPSGCSVCRYTNANEYENDAYFKQVSFGSDLSKFNNDRHFCPPDVSKMGRFGIEPTVDLSGKDVDQNIIGSIKRLDLSSMNASDFVISNRTIGIKNIETLVMKNSNIGPELRKFQFPKFLNLATANFENNSISKIEQDLFTENFPSIRIISLAHNFISSLHFDLENLQQLSTLHLQNNLFGPNLNCSEFGILAGIEFLDLSFNEIETINENYFTSFPNIKRLRLDGNKIKVFSFYFSHLPIENISLKNNKIRTIEEDKLEYTPKLRFLNLEGNVNLEGITITEDLKNVKITFSENLTSSKMNFQCRCTTGNFDSWYVKGNELKTYQRCLNPFGCSSCQVIEESVSHSGSRDQTIAFSQVPAGHLLTGNIVEPCAADTNYFGQLKNIESVSLHRIAADPLLQEVKILAFNSKGIYNLEESRQTHSMKSLIYLNMHNNSIGPSLRINNFPEYTKLVNLDLSKNNLSTIDDGFFETVCPNIKLMLLSQNNLSSLGIMNLKQLSMLDLSKNSFGNRLGKNSLPVLQNLNNLNIAGNGIETIDYNFFTERFPNLTKLRLDQNSIRIINFNLDIPNLTKLYLQSNKLGPYLSYSAPISNNLTHLDLSSNGIEWIRNDFFSTRIPNLEYLWLNGNKIEMFDIKLELPKLLTFSIANNSMIGCKRDAFSSTKLLKNLIVHEGNSIVIYHVDLSNRSLTDLVSGAGAYEIPHSVSLDVSSNFLGHYLNTSKSPRCVHAKSLNLENNGIERIEKDFFSLNFPNLESLDLARNKLIAVDFDLNLAYLSYITFYRNHLIYIEDWTISQALSLSHLTLMHNHKLSGFNLTKNLQGVELIFDAVGMDFNCQCKPGNDDDLVSVDYSGWGWNTYEERSNGRCLNENGCSQCRMIYDDDHMYSYVDFYHTPVGMPIKSKNVCPPDTNLFGNFTIQTVK